MKKTLEIEVLNEKISFETGNWAKQAHGSIVYRTGNLVLLATACASKEAKEGQDFFPLTCEYSEKLYSVGRFPGGYFKRESKPGEHEILFSRIIDRPIRPMFPEGYLCEVQVIVQVLSADKKISTPGHALTAASAALTISDIPFLGPIAGIRLGRIKGEFKVNPNNDEMLESDLDMIIAGTKDNIVMIEGEAQEVSNNEMLEALKFAQIAIAQLVKAQEDFSKDVSVKKREIKLIEKNKELVQKINQFAFDKLKKANSNPDKSNRSLEIEEVITTTIDHFKMDDPENDYSKDIKNILHEYEYEIVRDQVLNSGIRYDGRKVDEIREISCEVNVLPGAHGSAVFTRGQTQSLGVMTLGTGSDNQRYENLEGPKEKSFMLHYNFPAFSVGEVKKSTGPGRREIGHGNLAERALKVVLPKKDKFPYSIRLVSEILESNGSSSMASVCSGSLALMSGGVPIRSAVAGVAMGLFSKENKFEVLSDIAGLEDHFGDMDCKIAGTRKGITAFQMDLKITGVNKELMSRVLDQAEKGRNHILNIMEKFQPEVAKDLSEIAPRILVTSIPKDKIGELIGPGGKNVKAITEQTGADVYIEDNGTVTVSGPDYESTKRALDAVNGVSMELEIGKIYDGKVKKITDFGAFIEIAPGKEGLCHISKIDFKRVNSVEEFLKEGDKVRVKVLNIDQRSGKIDLSRKDALNE